MCDHLVLEADEGLLHVVVGSPALENVELGRLNSTVALVHAGNVHLGSKTDLGSLSGVVRAASDCQEVNAVVEVCVGRPNNRTVPLSESGVVS